MGGDFGGAEEQRLLGPVVNPRGHWSGPGWHRGRDALCLPETRLLPSADQLDPGAMGPEHAQARPVPVPRPQFPLHARQSRNVLQCALGESERGPESE